jgi:hypothetical protein
LQDPGYDVHMMNTINRSLAILLGIIVVVIMLMVGSAQAQTTTTFHHPDGTVTKISVSCDASGDCSVWDSTNELGIMARRHLLHQQQTFCKANGISDKTEKAWDSNTQLGGKNINAVCYEAWYKSISKDAK